MKLEPVIKVEKGNTLTSKKIDDDVMSANCDIIAFFLIYGQFAATQKPDSGCMFYKTYFLLTVIFYLIEPEKSL